MQRPLCKKFSILKEEIMPDNYARIVRGNLERLYDRLPPELERWLPAQRTGDAFDFKAFGENCRIAPGAITLAGREEWGVPGILISLYALHASGEVCVRTPLKAYKDFPDSMPYVGAFASHSEQVLVPHVERIDAARPQLARGFGLEDASGTAGGDFSFFVTPLPKIVLCYIFYRADDDFPASVTCLFSSNASRFLPLDALADAGEYTSKKILSLLQGGGE
jgi:hypothetical protein